MSTGASFWLSNGYVVVPSGVKYMSIVNNRWSQDSSYDRSLLNGITYNEGGSYAIVLLKCGNLEDIYKNKLKQGVNGASSDQMYANLRVQLKDGVNNYFTSGLSTDGKYWLEVYEAPYDGTELSDAELMASPHTTKAETTIHRITVDGKQQAEEVNRCVTIPVQKAHTYKVILYAGIGSRGSVEVGSTYFTVREEGSPVYGISAAIQMTGIRQMPYGDYVLNKDITMTEDLPYNAGMLYGELDLQGHILTTTRAGGIFDGIGSAAKRQGAVRNGTIQFSMIRSDGSRSALCGNSYGTLENLNFKVDVQNPYTVAGSGKDKTYDNSMWNSETDTYVISYNEGTIRNFTIEYQSDFVSCYRTGFVNGNAGLIYNGYIYGDGAVLGGGYVGGLAAINEAKGEIRNIYSTIVPSPTISLVWAVISGPPIRPVRS